MGTLKIPIIYFWENEKSFLGTFLGNTFINESPEKRGVAMRKKSYKGRCEKRTLSKCQDICRTYDAIQYGYADILESNNAIKEIRCNVLLDGLEDGEYTSDFVCVKADNDLMVRECVFRKYLTKPLTVKLLDASKEYWSRRGVTDWGLVIDADK